MYELGPRLRRIEGQIQGLSRMVEATRDCDEILLQILAVRSALASLGARLAHEELAACSADPQIVARVLRILASPGSTGEA